MDSYNPYTNKSLDNQTTQMPATGLPIAALILALCTIPFVGFRRK